MLSNSDTSEVVGGIDAVSKASASAVLPPAGMPSPTELAVTLALPLLK